jgi:hypothetical protein
MSKLAHMDIILKAKKLTMNVPLDTNPNNNVKKFVKPVTTKINYFSMPHTTTVQQYSCRGLSGNGVDITLLIRGRRWPMENMLLQLHPCGVVVVVVVGSAFTWVLPYHLTL